MKTRFFFAYLLIASSYNLFAQLPLNTVRKFGSAMKEWCRTDDISYHEQAKELATGKMKCIVDDKIAQDAVEKDESKLLTKGTQEIMSYLNIFQNAILDGQKYEMLNVKDRPDFVEPSAFKNEEPPNFVSADLLLSGSLNYNVTDIFYVREGKITKIIDYTSDVSFGKALELYAKRNYNEAFKMFRALAYAEYGNFDAQYYMITMEINKQGCDFLSKKVRDKEIVWFACKNYFAGNSDVVKLAMKYPMDDSFLDYSHFPNLYKWIIGFRQPMASGLMMSFDSKTLSCRFVDEKGKLVIPHKYKTAFPFHNGRSLVVSKTTNLCGFIDEAGNEVVPMIYGSALSDFYKGRTWCIKDGNAYLIDSQGAVIKVISGYSFVNALQPVGCYAMLHKSENLFDIYDYNGNLCYEGYTSWNVKFKTGVVSMIKPDGPKVIYRVEW